jgi:uncharacterized peroxidase-related enzyme
MPADEERVHALDLPEQPDADLPAAMATYLAKCREKLGFVPNVLRAYAFDGDKLQRFVEFHDDLMLADSPLTKLEREMIAVVVSSRNHCWYCLTAHGAAVRRLAKDPAFGDVLVANWRAADLSPRHRAMCEFVEKLTDAPDAMEDEDRQALRETGFDDRAIWDIAAVAAFFAMTNRLASAVDLRPNPEYHGQARGRAS